jgi:hypothetical protein
MSWEQVSRKHGKKYLRDSVHCDDLVEREYLIEIIKEEFPEIDESNIKLGILQCCLELKGSLPTDLFITMLKKKLEIFFSPHDV